MHRGFPCVDGNGRRPPCGLRSRGARAQPARAGDRKTPSCEDNWSKPSRSRSEHLTPRTADAGVTEGNGTPPLLVEARYALHSWGVVTGVLVGSSPCRKATGEWSRGAKLYLGRVNLAPRPSLSLPPRCYEPVPSPSSRSLILPPGLGSPVAVRLRRYLVCRRPRFRLVRSSNSLDRDNARSDRPTSPSGLVLGS